MRSNRTSEQPARANGKSKLREKMGPKEKR